VLRPDCSPDVPRYLRDVEHEPVAAARYNWVPRTLREWYELRCGWLLRLDPPQIWRIRISFPHRTNELIISACPRTAAELLRFRPLQPAWLAQLQLRRHWRDIKLRRTQWTACQGELAVIVRKLGGCNLLEHSFAFAVIDRDRYEIRFAFRYITHRGKDVL
jgi:hypothetical protein